MLVDTFTTVAYRISKKACNSLANLIDTLEKKSIYKYFIKVLGQELGLRKVKIKYRAYTTFRGAPLHFK